MSVATVSKPKVDLPREIGGGDVSEELKAFWRLAGEGYRQSLAMGLTDETIEDFIDEVIHEGREIRESVR